MRSKLKRLAPLHESVKPYLQRRKVKDAQDRTVLVEVARDHAIALAALVLHGNPKLTEPLEMAWERCLTRFPEPGRPTWVFQSVLKELPGETRTQKFQHLFDIAPPWLLKFSCAPITADILGLRCPDLSGAPREGRNAQDQFLCWPDLPQGTLQGGGPVPPFREELLSDDERRELGEQIADLFEEVHTDCLNEGVMPTFDPRGMRRRLKSLVYTGKVLKNRGTTKRKHG